MLSLQFHVSNKCCKLFVYDTLPNTTTKSADMSKSKHPFSFKYSEEKNFSDYLGSDSLPIGETYNLYLKKCDEFKAKARKYARNNLSLKNSYIHHIKYGYEGTEELEEEVLWQRKEQMMEYRRAFDITSFDEDPNSMYECFNGKSKRVRIIRELQEERAEEYSEDFDKKKTSWFKGYCVLSKFIEAARKIILLNRLEKALAILRLQIPEIIRQNDETERELKAKEMKSELKLKKRCCEHFLSTSDIQEKTEI